MSDRWIVIGGGGHAKVIISVLKELYGDVVNGYTDLSDQGELLGISWLGNDEILDDDTGGEKINLALAVGSLRPSQAKKREELFNQFSVKGINFPAIIAPGVNVAESVQIEEATFIGDGAIINPDSKIGCGAIVNTGAIVEHDCEIDCWAHIAPGVTLGGHVSIGKYSHIGSGAVVVNGCQISPEVLIGAGATVVKDCLEPGTYLGTPAKKVN